MEYGVQVSVEDSERFHTPLSTSQRSSCQVLSHSLHQILGTQIEHVQFPYSSRFCLLRSSCQCFRLGSAYLVSSAFLDHVAKRDAAITSSGLCHVVQQR